MRLHAHALKQRVLLASAPRALAASCSRALRFAPRPLGGMGGVLCGFQGGQIRQIAEPHVETWRRMVAAMTCNQASYRALCSSANPAEVSQNKLLGSRGARIPGHTGVQASLKL